MDNKDSFEECPQRLGPCNDLRQWLETNQADLPDKVTYLAINFGQ